MTEKASTVERDWLGRRILTEVEITAIVRWRNLQIVQTARWDKASDELLAQVAALVSVRIPGNS